jgi:hypothetical protein
MPDGWGTERDLDIPIWKLPNPSAGLAAALDRQRNGLRHVTDMVRLRNVFGNSTEPG